MTKIQKWWARMSFWNKLEKSFGLLGGITVAELGMHDVDSKWFVVIGISGVIAKLLFIWIEDNDKNGIIDFLEEDETKP